MPTTSRRYASGVTWTILAATFVTAGAGAQGPALDPSGTNAALPSRAPEGAAPAEAAAGGQALPAPTAPAPETGTAKKWPKPYKDQFFRNDFSYLDDPNYVSHDPFDALKRIELAPLVRLDVGGEVRLRLHDEDNLRLDGKSNDYLLQRTRLYGDLRYDDWLRGYAELIDSTISFNRNPPRASEEDRADVLNLFLDLKLWEDDSGGSLWARGGRQELDFGSQRLLGSAEWANDRNTFDGVTALWRSKSWDVDVFWARPVPFARTEADVRNFRPPDYTEQFLGAFATWHEVKDHTVDLYFLRLERDRQVRIGDPPLVPFDANTFGARWLGRQDNWLWEVEGAYQFGRFSGDVQSAGFFVAGAGRQFERLPWKPTLWLYYDWASGDDDPNDHFRGTFNQLFPHAHRYLGLGDVVGRQNLVDLNFLLLAQPHERVALIAEGHLFRLESARDSLYNNGGAPVRTDRTGRAGTDVGQELDFSVRVRLTFHADLLVSCGHFFAGPYLANTGIGKDGDFLYVQLAFRF